MKGHTLESISDPNLRRSHSPRGPSTPGTVHKSTASRKSPECSSLSHISSCDRFIPNRSVMDPSISTYEIETSTQRAALDVNASPAKEAYKKSLATHLFHGTPYNNPVLSFSALSHSGTARYALSALEAAEDISALRLHYCQNHQRSSGSVHNVVGRYVPQSPERILDAPELIDDYYLNLLGWNSDNILGIALCESVYLWNAGSGSVTPLAQMVGQGSHVTSLAWKKKGPYMAVGAADEVQIWDTERCAMIRSMRGHCSRVGALTWEGSLVSSGSRDTTIMHHDVRSPQQSVATLRAHSQEVCGLRWSETGGQLASGGNDNMLYVWDCRRHTPLHSFSEHQAAVKALAWCPWQKGLLASGGGTQDRMVRFWNTSTGTFLNAVDTHSQVCALEWSRHAKELVSSHGYCHNQLVLWQYPSMIKVAELTGHTARVLHLAQSPDGHTVVSAAADETLRFWRIFGRGARLGRSRSQNLLDNSAWNAVR